MDLLDYLTSLLHCEYLSDLKYFQITRTGMHEIYDLPETLFSCEEYSRAISYLTGNQVKISSIRQGKDLLVSILSRENKHSQS